MTQENQPITMELVSSETALSATEQISRAEIDCQIATAHKFPRSMKKFKERAIEMATLDEETAASCLYSRPVGGGKFAEGLSVRTAEIVGASYGNLRVAAMIVEQTERYVKARGMAHDLESNFASACEVIESTVKKDGTPYDERMRIVIAKACLAKARRDATFQVVPKALCKPVEIAARAVAVGDAATIGKRREQVMQWIGKLGIDSSRVFAAINVKGVDDIGLDELTQLTGIKTAIKDGEVQVDEAFPSIPKRANVDSPALKSLRTAQEPKTASKAEEPVKVAPMPVQEAQIAIPEPETEPDAIPFDPEPPFNTAEPSPEYSKLSLLMEKSGVTEAQVLKFCWDKKLADASITELAQLKDSKLKNIGMAWPTIIVGIKAIKV